MQKSNKRRRNACACVLLSVKREKVGEERRSPFAENRQPPERKSDCPSAGPCANHNLGGLVIGQRRESPDCLARDESSMKNVSLLDVSTAAAAVVERQIYRLGEKGRKNAGEKSIVY